MLLGLLYRDDVSLEPPERDTGWDEQSTEEKLKWCPGGWGEQGHTALSALLDPALPEARALSELLDTHKPVHSQFCLRPFKLNFCYF